MVILNLKLSVKRLDSFENCYVRSNYLSWNRQETTGERRSIMCFLKKCLLERNVHSDDDEKNINNHHAING